MDLKTVNLQGNLDIKGKIFQQLVNGFEIDFSNRNGWETIIYAKEGLGFSCSINKNGIIRFWIKKNLELFIERLYFILQKVMRINREDFKILIKELKTPENLEQIFKVGTLTKKVNILNDFKRVIKDPLFKIMANHENSLRDYLYLHPELIEKGLVSLEKEYSTDVGRIDILCKDRKDNFVIIEIKKSSNSDRVLGQIQRYMGWVGIHLANIEYNKVRGIIIQFIRDKKLDYALKTSRNIEVKYYRFKLLLSDREIKL